MLVVVPVHSKRKRVPALDGGGGSGSAYQRVRLQQQQQQELRRSWSMNCVSVYVCKS